MNSLFEVRLSKSNKQESSSNSAVKFLFKIYPNVMIVYANCEKNANKQGKTF